jgi:carboxylesterase
MLLGALVVFLVVGAALRERRIEALTALTLTRRRLGSNGIVIGGEGFVLERANAPAILLLHGAGDTPQTLRYLAEYLHTRGYHVEVPLLPGHGRSVKEFRQITADALTSAAFAEYERIRSEREWVGVIGLSMGGALAVQIAARYSDLPALGLAAPYLEMPGRIARAARLSHLWGPVVPLVASTEGRSILDPAEQDKNLAYGVFTAAALRALHDTVQRAADSLPRVVAPTLVVQSREDNRISVAAAERAFARIGAKQKRLEWLTGASHVITVDFGRERVFEMLASWMDQHRGAAATR